MAESGMMGRLTALHVYPVKACRGLRLERAELGTPGLGTTGAG